MVGLSSDRACCSCKSRLLTICFHTVHVDFHPSLTGKDKSSHRSVDISLTFSCDLSNTIFAGTVILDYMCACHLFYRFYLGSIIIVTSVSAEITTCFLIASRLKFSLLQIAFYQIGSEWHFTFAVTPHSLHNCSFSAARYKSVLYYHSGLSLRRREAL